MTQATNNTSHWDEGDSQTFIDYGHYFVPDREIQTDIICSLIPATSKQHHILDLCCGEGVLTRTLLEHFPTYRVHGYDGSPAMLERAKSLLAGYGERFETHLFELADSDWRTLPWPVHAVVSSLAIHHLNADQKQELFRDIRQMLAPGGIFILADCIQPITELGLELAARMYDETIHERSLQLSGNLQAYEHFLAVGWNTFADPEPDPLDKLSPLFDQLKWLEQAGFADVDVFWVKAGHAIFGGRRAV